MSLLGRYTRLSAADRRLLLRAWRLMVAARAGLTVMAFPRIRRAMDRLARPLRNGETAPVERIAWSIRAAGRRVPNATCLVQALAGHTLMARYGHRGELRLGVMRDDRGRFAAHAWVEYNGRAVIGQEERGAFTPLPPLKAAGR